MNAHEAAPGAGTPETRQIRSGNGCHSSALAATFNSISTEPRTYDALQLDMRERRPRLMDAAIDRALARLIQQRAVWLSDDCRWTARR